MDALALLILFGIAVVLILITSAASGPKKEYGAKSATAKGEKVRSIAERKIAEYLARCARLTRRERMCTRVNKESLSIE